MITNPPLSFSEAINKFMNQIFQFHGRSRRSEYWKTMLLVWLINIVLTPFIGILADIATIPLTFRRLHDTGKSGWVWGIYKILQFVFLASLFYHYISDYWTETLAWKYGIGAFVILIYKIVLLIFLCQDSNSNRNKYGESLKYINDEICS